jgi:hypothetical protein
MLEQMTIDKYLQTKFNSKIIIRIADDVAFIYKIEKDWIKLVDCCLAFDKQENYHRIVRDYLKKYNYAESNIQLQSTYKEMVDSLNADYRLSEFEKSDRQFPSELFDKK